MSKSRSSQSNVDLRHLKAFLIVVEELNFSRAAKRLGISQPPLSRQIQRLEASVNVQLFDRSRTQIQLTEAGRVFAKSARQIVEQLERSVLEAQLVASGQSGLMIVGIDGTALACYKAIQAVSNYQNHVPNVKIQIKGLTVSEQIEALQLEKISVGFMNPLDFATERLPAELDSVAISQDELVVVLPESHALATQLGVALSDLSDELVMIPRSLQRVLNADDELPEQALLNLSINQDAHGDCLIIGLVASGEGLAILPRSTQALASVKGLTSGQAVLYRPLLPTICVDDLTAIWRQDESSSVVLSFVERLREANIHLDTPT